MILIPIKIETPYIKWPISNMVIIVVTVLFFFFYATGGVSDDVIESMVLRDWNILQMLSCLFLHAGLLHLVGNMLFLWVFGNVINAAIGNGFYPVSYFCLGICASIMHLIFSGGPAVGASGAINGIVGMTLMLYPISKMKCFYFFTVFFIWKWGTFRIKNFWMILLWLTFDVLGALFGTDNTAYWAHIGGFLGGMGIGYLMILFKLIDTYEPTLVDIITGNTLKEEPSYKVEPQLDFIPEGRVDGIAGDFVNQQNIQEYQIRDNIQLMEIQRKDEELAQMNNSVLPGVNDNVIPEPVESREINLRIRLLRPVRKDNLVTCYFVNEGDTISNVEIETTGAETAEIYPKDVIKSRDTGTIKFTNSDPEMNLKFRLYYSDGAVQILYKDFIFSEFERRIYEVS